MGLRQFQTRVTNTGGDKGQVSDLHHNRSSRLSPGSEEPASLFWKLWCLGQPNPNLKACVKLSG